MSTMWNSKSTPVIFFLLPSHDSLIWQARASMRPAPMAAVGELPPGCRGLWVRESFALAPLWLVHTWRATSACDGTRDHSHRTRSWSWSPSCRHPRRTRAVSWPPQQWTRRWQALSGQRLERSSSSPAAVAGEVSPPPRCGHGRPCHVCSRLKMNLRTLWLF
jgi:hypothetical protein